MTEIQILEFLKGFASGNTLILLYLAVSIVRMVIKPLYSNGKKISALVESVTRAINDGVFSHDDIVNELKTLNSLMTRQNPS